MTESALAAIEVVLIIKTKVYRSLNMGVLQGGRATPAQGCTPATPCKPSKPLVLLAFSLWGTPWETENH